MEAGLDATWLNSVAEHIPGHALTAVLNWVVATLTIDGLVNQIDDGTSRIANLVGAIKSYSYMDQAPQQEVNIHEGLESTLTLLGHKLKQGHITVKRDYDLTLPRVCAYGSELNQVWTNSLDNAIYAVAGEGCITLRTAQEGDKILVEIGDDGPGIPETVRDHIFEPFFTTKGVGQGTGLGLVTSYRIVAGRHKGDMRFESQPGNTRFQVRLPLR